MSQPDAPWPIHLELCLLHVNSFIIISLKLHKNLDGICEKAHFTEDSTLAGFKRMHEVSEWRAKFLPTSVNL